MNSEFKNNVGKVKTAVLKKQYRDFENPTPGTNLKISGIEKTIHFFQNPSKTRQDLEKILKMLKPKFNRF